MKEEETRKGKKVDKGNTRRKGLKKRCVKETSEKKVWKESFGNN